MVVQNNGIIMPFNYIIFEETKGLMSFFFPFCCLRPGTKSWCMIVERWAAGWCSIKKMDPSVQQAAAVHSFVMHAHRNVKIVAYNMLFVPLSVVEIIAI